MKTFALVLVLSASALADEVVLKGGGRISGVVEEKGDVVVVRTEHGTVAVGRERVERIDRSKGSTLQEYEELLKKADTSKASDVEALLAWVEARKMGEATRELRERLCRLRWDAADRSDPARLEDFAAWAKGIGCLPQAELALRTALGLRREKTGGKDAEGLYQLGLWAKARGLAADALVCFQEALAADGGHEFARRALGFQWFQGKWMTDREVKVAMGLIEFEGEWTTPGAKEAIVQARTLEKERKLLEEARKRLEEDRAKARAEHERELAALDGRRSEIARQIADLERLRAAPACGLAGCLAAGLHVHCARAGCLLTAWHVHCGQPGCALLGVHKH